MQACAMANRLIDETSPYLQQHAHNPVDWFAWGDEALARARGLDRPILLSVGYSSCHWCHVMERESFEDPGIAAQMNRDFVCIKVDREERPDIDSVYMKAVQAFTGGRGGWPMTVFATPGGRPFFGGTYFPARPRGGMPGFSQVMTHALNIYRGDQERLGTLTSQVLARVARQGDLPPAEEQLRGDWLERVVAACNEDFDEVWGGFGKTPKFPPHGRLAVLLAHHGETGSTRSLEMVTRTLDAMAYGAMYDLLGGGFARYSVDDHWRVPHFEKMLSDNAQLLPLYADAWLLTKAPYYKRIVEETIGWAMREMRDAGGGFYTAQDADTDGDEGRFFVFTLDELRDCLGDADGLRAAELFEVSDSGTFEHGTSVLRLQPELERRSADDQAFLGRVMPLLFQARERRTRPGRDDKVLAGCNGLMVAAVARCGVVFERDDWLDVAERAATFLAEHLSVVEGIDGRRRLMRTYKDGIARIPGFVDDHAYVLLGFIELWHARFDRRWLDAADSLAARMIELFWDPDGGGFFYTGDDAERLVYRSKTMLGGALPAANGAAALALVKLGALLDRPDWSERAGRVLRSYQVLLDNGPAALGIEALAGHWLHRGGLEIAIVGGTAVQRDVLLREVRSEPRPFAITVVADRAADVALPWLAGKDALAEAALAWVCQDKTCKLPTADRDELKRHLEEPGRRARREPAPTKMRAPPLPADPAMWLNSEEPIRLEQWLGDVVVLDFWTSCCINCLHVLPELAAVERKFAGRPVHVVGVHSAKFDAETSAEHVRRAMQRHGIHHPVVLDSERQTWGAYDVKGWPTIVVIDPRGRIAWRRSGETDRRTLARVVQRLLDSGEEAIVEPAGANVGAETSGQPTGGLRFPGKLALHGDALFIADSGNNRIIEATLRKDGGGWPSLDERRHWGGQAAGFRDGEPVDARFRGPQGVAVTDTTVFVADTDNHAIRAIDRQTGLVTTVAGTGNRGSGHPAVSTHPLDVDLRSPWDVATTAGVVVIAMAGSHQLWIYDPGDERLGPICGTGREDHVDGAFDASALAQPSGLVARGAGLFWVDAETSSVRVGNLQTRKVATVVGRGLFDFGDVDGGPEAARLQHPLGLCVDGDQLLVADTYNHKVKRIGLADGVVSTVLGGNGELCDPSDVVVAAEHLLVADTGNHRIVALDPATGTWRTVAFGGELPSGTTRCAGHEC